MIELFAVYPNAVVFNKDYTSYNKSISFKNVQNLENFFPHIFYLKISPQMIESSDDEIIQRKRPNTRKTRFSSDSSSSNSFESDLRVLEGDFEPIFFEIFGNGDEYDYVYTDENQPREEISKNETEIIVSDCYNYIQSFYRGFKSIFKGFSQDCVRDLAEGYSPEYLAFHMNRMTVRELYFTKDLIDEFRKFSCHKNKNYGMDTYTSAIYYNGKQSDLNVPGILNISEYTHNLINFESVITPSVPVDLPVTLSTLKHESGWDNEPLPYIDQYNPTNLKLTEIDTENISNFFKKTILQLSTNSIFIDRVIKSKIVEKIEPEYASSSAFSLSFLQKLYSSGKGDFNDSIRSIIIEHAYNSVKVTRKEIEEPLKSSGFLEEPNSLSDLVNIIVSMQGKPGTYAGVYFDNGFFSAVKIDRYGNVEKTGVFREFQTVELHSFLQDSKNIILTSTSSNVRYVIQNTDINFMYLPRRFSYFHDLKELSIPYSIALAIQNPVVYFSKVLYNLRNNLPVKFHIDNLNILERSILIASAMRKIDWKSTLEHKFGYTFFNLLDIDLTNRNFNIEGLNKLENLSQIYNKIKFANICTFFCLEDSENPLDRTFVHPNNYSLASIFCQGLYHKLLNDKCDAIMCYEKLDVMRDQAKVVALIVNQPGLLEYFCTPTSASEEERSSLIGMKKILMRLNEASFSGASDLQIFEDVVPNLELNKIYSGTVSKTGSDFFLCDVNNSTVYVKKSAELSTNQIVQIEVVDRKPDLLSYEGLILDNKIQTVDKFKTHPLFRNLDHLSLEKYMESNSFSILIRPSSTSSHCVVVCKLDKGIYLPLKVRESFENTKFHYDFKGERYQSIDKFIESYVKPIYIHLNKILNFKYYFKNRNEAIEYLQTPGEYVKYCIILSREALGYLELFISGRKFLIKLDGPKLVFQNYKFNSLDEVISFFKTHNQKLR